MADTGDSAFKVGDRIVATAAAFNGQIGIIKYIGPVISSLHSYLLTGNWCQRNMVRC